jgi:hypothetical protein
LSETDSARQDRLTFLRNVLAQVPKGSAEMVAAAVRTIFAQPCPVDVQLTAKLIRQGGI